MRSSTPRQTSQPRQPTRRVPTVCVVDPKADDYQGWDELVHANGVQLNFVATAEDALRLARTTAVDLWVVNIELQGLSGLALCSMLNSGSARPTVYVIANHYSPEAEHAAWCARATMFGCKGAHKGWFQDWITQCRRGPAPNHAHRPRLSGSRLS